MTGETIFHDALAKPPAERAAFLDRICADKPGLRAEVEALLAAHDASHHPLDRPAEHTSAFDDNFRGTSEFSSAQAGVVIAGRYTLEQKIGEGGMGEVWVAKQTEPVKRRVALKLIKAGMDSKAVLQRFEQERQALALMDHPNIAKVLDGGLTEQSRPFFVMELVNGLPLTKFCDEAKLGIRERLELFVPICQAVQHAHQKGIVHRDLKPSNILVTMIDGKPVPKVIDFGVAKATSGKLIDDTLSTQFGAVVGTLEYMSPEQAGFSGQDIDTRSDIYSLGVILYELLTGLRPLDAKRLKQAAYAEMIRIIQEEEPSKPSTRLSTDESLPSLAAIRQTEPKRLMALLRGELDWLVMKCLEKQRDRRYETANGLARDIQRYLADEPVEARPPSVGYRAKKFLRRNRGPVLAAALVLLTLIGGMVGTSVGMIRAESRRIEADNARKDEAQQRGIADAERNKAEKAEMETLDDYREATGEAIQQLIGSKPQLGPSARAYLETTVRRWQAFAQRRGDDERSRHIRIEGHMQVANIWHLLLRLQDARTEYERALAVAQDLVERFPTTAARQKLADVHINLGGVLRGLEDENAAIAHFRKAGELFAGLAGDMPATYRGRLALVHFNLGLINNRLGKWPEAHKELTTARDLYGQLEPPHSTTHQVRADVASLRHTLANVMWQLGQREAAVAEMQVSVALLHDVAASTFRPHDIHLWGNAHSTLAAQLAQLGKVDEAIVTNRRGQGVLKKLAQQFPSFPSAKHDLALAHYNLGLLFKETGKFSEARAEYEAARELQIACLAAPDTNQRLTEELAETRINLARVYEALNLKKEAFVENEEALKQLQKLVDARPEREAYKFPLAIAALNHGVSLFEASRLAEAVPWYGKAIENLELLYRTRTNEPTLKAALKTCHQNRAVVREKLGALQDAIQDWNRVIELCTKEEQFGARPYRIVLRIRLGQVAETMAELDEISTWEGADPNGWYCLACGYSLASGKVPDRQKEWADKAMAMLHKSVKAGFRDHAHIEMDPDLEPIRGRNDYKALLASLKGKP